MADSQQLAAPVIALTEDVEIDGQREWIYGILKLKFKNKEFEKLYRLFFEKVNRSLLVVVCCLMVFLGIFYFLNFLAGEKVSDIACIRSVDECKVV